MAEYINRDVAIDALKKDVMGGLNYENILKNIPAADVQREKKLEYALLLMVYQYCVDNYQLHHQYMVAGEEAFRVLGITLDTPVKEIEDRIDQLESEGL